MSGKGLEGVVAAETRISRVLGEEGRLTYAGYDIEDLAENASFEEVCHLLWYGRLPRRAELEALSSRLRAALPVDPRILDIARTGATLTHPMAVLRTAVSALAFTDPDAEDNARAALERKAIRLTAQAITLTAAIGRFRSGLDALTPRSDLGLAANFLYMLRGHPADALEARTIECSLCASRRARDERVDIRGPRDGGHLERHALRHGLRHWNTQGSVARRRQ